jgi:hypothetical protein
MLLGYVGVLIGLSALIRACISSRIANMLEPLANRGPWS